MPNWVAEFLNANPQYAAMPVVKRDRRSIHFRRPDGLIEAMFTGAPMHWLDGAEWRPIDTALRLLASGNYGADGVPVEIAPDRTVRVGSYGQRTRRVGLFDPDTRVFTSVFTVPVGSVQGDSLVASGAIWEHRLRLMEDGLRETLTLTQRPQVAAGPNDWLVLETQLWGVSFPDGWVDEFSASGMSFGLPTCTDAAGASPPQCRRYARKDGATQLLYTGIPVSWLATAQYPVVLDPDFAGSTADGIIFGYDSVYATARSTTYGYNSTVTNLRLGQYLAPSYVVIRSFLKFDTSAIGTGSTVTQVNLKLVCISDDSATDFDVQIVKQDWSGQDPLSDANREAAYDNCLAGDLDDNIWRNTLNMNINEQYASGNLATAWVNKIGNTYYSLRSDRDKAGTTPTGYENILPASAEHATAGYRPVLTVEYSAGGAPQTLTPGAAVATLVAPAIAVGLTLTLVPSPATATLVAPTATLSLTLVVAAAPAIVILTAPAATVALTLVLAPSPAILTLAAPAASVALTLVLAPSPAILTLAAPAASVALGALTLTPGVAVVLLVAPAVSVALSLTLTPSTAVLSLVAPSASVSLGAITLIPGVAVLALVAISPMLVLSLTLTPSPAVLILTAPGATAILGALVVAANPAILNLIAPAAAMAFWAPLLGHLQVSEYHMTSVGSILRSRRAG